MMQQNCVAAADAGFILMLMLMLALATMLDCLPVSDLLLLRFIFILLLMLSWHQY